MDSTVIVGILSLVGTLSGTFFGIMKSASMTNYRIAQLEAKVDKHNCFDTRITKVEESTKQAHKRIDELREEIA